MFYSPIFRYRLNLRSYFPPYLDDCVKPSLRKEYFIVKRKWMPADSCNDHFDEYLECKLNKKEWKPSKCCQDFKKHEN